MYRGVYLAHVVLVSQNELKSDPTYGESTIRPIGEASKGLVTQEPCKDGVGDVIDRIDGKVSRCSVLVSNSMTDDIRAN